MSFPAASLSVVNGTPVWNHCSNPTMKLEDPGSHWHINLGRDPDLVTDALVTNFLSLVSWP